MSTAENSSGIVDRVSRHYREFVNPGMLKLASLLSLDKVEAEAKGCVVRTESGDEYPNFLGYA